VFDANGRKVAFGRMGYPCYWPVDSRPGSPKDVEHLMNRMVPES
jgi:hypothetical protein